MNRIARQEFTLPKYGKLLTDINNLIVAVIIHHTAPVPESEKEKFEKVRTQVEKPTWQNVVDLLQRAEKEISQDRYNPVKY